MRTNSHVLGPTGALPEAAVAAPRREETHASSIADVADVAMAEASAHLLSAYKNFETLKALSSPYAALLSMEDAIHYVCAALVALEDCCAAVWSWPEHSCPVGAGTAKHSIDHLTNPTL
ncbi:MAG TPA: hypothetical protein VMD59_08695 [Acidimicrobiales bacterium]|nr:hypothetical protein [Acidimicrobiales bacterium]